MRPTPVQASHIQQESISHPHPDTSSIRYPSLYYSSSQPLQNLESTAGLNYSLQPFNVRNSTSVISSIPQESLQPYPTRTSQFFSFFKQNLSQKEDLDCSMLLKDLSQAQPEDTQRPQSNRFEDKSITQDQKKIQSPKNLGKMSRTQFFMSLFRHQNQNENNQKGKNTQEHRRFVLKEEEKVEILQDKQNKKEFEEHEQSQQIPSSPKNQLTQQNKEPVQDILRYETKRPPQQENQSSDFNQEGGNIKFQKINCVSASEPKIVDSSASNSSENFGRLQVQTKLHQKKEEDQVESQQAQEKKVVQEQDNEIVQKVEQDQDSVELQQSQQVSFFGNKGEQKTEKNEEISLIKIEPKEEEPEQWQSESEQYIDSVVVQQTENQILVQNSQGEHEQQEQEQEEEAQVLAIPQNTNSIETLKSLIIGLYTYNKFTPALITSLENTMVQYYPSNYFNAGPRREILNAISELMNLVKQVAKYTADQVHTKHAQLTGSLIQANKIDQNVYKLAFEEPLKALGNQLRLFWDENDMAELSDIVSSYTGSNYFHVGERRQIFSEVANVIKQVKRTHKQIMVKLVVINPKYRQDDQEQQEQEQEYEEEQEEDEEDEEDEDQDQDQDQDELHQIPSVNQPGGNQLSNQSFYSTASTQVTFKEVPVYTVEDLKSYECGRFLKQKMSPQLVASLKSTISQYDSSNYFHVGPRYQLLGLMTSFAQFVGKIEASVTLPPLSQNSNTDKLIKTGQKLRKYMNPTKISSINSTCGTYYNSKYFHVGPRYSILDDARKVIEFYSQIN